MKKLERECSFFFSFNLYSRVLVFYIVIVVVYLEMKNCTDRSI